MFFRNKSGGVRWLVVFLGNPGTEYDKTRHNVGFMTADIIEQQEKIRINRLRHTALTATAELAGERVFLMKPQTYMNLSGRAVGPAASFYKIPPDRVIVVSDDVALPIGTIRVKTKGSSGGHNGLKSIIAALGTDEFPRIKIGVGAPADESHEHNMADWVLGRFTDKDMKTITKNCEDAARAISVFIESGASKAMNMFN